MRSAPVSDRFVSEYLSSNSSHPDRPWTVGTFLARRLKGRAYNYKTHYERRILQRLAALESLGQVRRVRSAGGRTAWLPVD
ncbi:MAG: hypothetical protein KatS3mg038_3134 [Candidatus Kapaibacterium sp.]|nr:MAG: hypothetical protein KatS3mg038_0447 [Candidatus Kapabacteria bacterium]GIV51084.1 MAG: hypothetical protein KatS3mg038_1605 [Candidatus Kapabacteria bacterium]GIV52613.1 MAG: hypothetical protein KatS3mg038_3134 [Candidatus Kapabacteria bacterium]